MCVCVCVCVCRMREAVRKMEEKHFAEHTEEHVEFLPVEWRSKLALDGGRFKLPNTHTHTHTHTEAMDLF